ncbi:C-lysozyme inhibitor [Klebsiella pneumoniae subsp. ozaenae]|uniref:C-lysozyme inhibitor n=1 Tax=Klebsiella pneumoniae subsp. ozaenae TaxID=574 RepID=A0A377Z8F0_KLEPO|nr:C-lysozyme inhibitor [Klebsiella pneumoniae subsp. ozaenae]
MFKALTAIVALAASASVMAQGDVTLNSLAHDAPPGRRLTRWSKAISCPPG